MRRVRLSVAMSLDGYIAGPNGEYDWIVIDPEIDFAALIGQFDTALMGRKSFEAAQQMGGAMAVEGMATFVFSRTLRQEDCPGVTVSGDLAETVATLKTQPGKDVWLFGGGELFRSMLALGLVDSIEVEVIPVLLGAGLPLFPPPAEQVKLKLVQQRVYSQTGSVSLVYEPAQ